MGENQRRDSDHEQEPEHVARLVGNEETCRQEEPERAEQRDAADKTPLLADGGKNVVVMHGGRGQKAELDLCVRRLESFPRPTARADRDEGLIDRPGRSLAIDIGIDERSDPLLLVWLEPDVGDRDKRDRDQHHANQIAQRNPAHEKQREQDRSPDHGFAEVRLHEDEQTGRADDRATERQAKHRMHLPELAEK